MILEYFHCMEGEECADAFMAACQNRLDMIEQTISSLQEASASWWPFKRSNAQKKIACENVKKLEVMQAMLNYSMTKPTSDKKRKIGSEESIVQVVVKKTKVAQSTPSRRNVNESIRGFCLVGGKTANLQVSHVLARDWSIDDTYFLRTTFWESHCDEGVKWDLHGSRNLVMLCHEHHVSFDSSINPGFTLFYHINCVGEKHVYLKALTKNYEQVISRAMERLDTKEILLSEVLSLRSVAARCAFSLRMHGKRRERLLDKAQSDSTGESTSSDCRNMFQFAEVNG